MVAQMESKKLKHLMFGFLLSAMLCACGNQDGKNHSTNAEDISKSDVSNDASEIVDPTQETIEEVYLTENEIAEKKQLPKNAFYIDLTPTGRESYARVVLRFTLQPSGKDYKLVFDISSNEMIRQRDYWEKVDYMDYYDLIGETNKAKFELEAENNRKKVDELSIKMYDAVVAGNDDLARQIGKEIERLNEPIDTYRSWYLKFDRIYKYSIPFFKKLVLGLKPLFTAEALSPEQTLAFVIQMVQSIEYWIPEQNGSSGFFSPIWVLATLKGDCDSRSVLLYGILKTMGYDMAIFYSSAYQHIMCGINIPANGVFMTCKGKNYYFIESITPNSPIGAIRKDWSDLSGWVVTNY